MGIFAKMRNATFNFIEREGDFTLHFFADFIRGHSTKKQKTKEESLTKEEQRVFKESLKRRKGETQIEYWKREKSMLNMKDKKAFVKRAMANKKKQEKSKSKERLIIVEKEKRSNQLQMRMQKMANSNEQIKKQSAKR